MPALLSSLAYKSFYLFSPTVQKCWVVPGLSSGVKQPFLEENPVAVLVTCLRVTPKVQHEQGSTSFGFLCCTQTCKTIPAGSDPSNVTSPFVSCF